jgi:hypothetical protein
MMTAGDPDSPHGAVRDGPGNDLVLRIELSALGPSDVGRRGLRAAVQTAYYHGYRIV